MKKAYWIFIGISIIAVVVGSVFASYAYEPLDKSAEQLGLKAESLFEAPFPEYSIPGLSPELGGILSGILGVFVILLIFLMVRFVVGAKRA